MEKNSAERFKVLGQLNSEDRQLMISMIASIAKRDHAQMARCVKFDCITLTDLLDYLDNLQIQFSHTTNECIDQAMVGKREEGDYQIHVSLLREDNSESYAVAVFIFNPSSAQSRVTVGYIYEP